MSFKVRHSYHLVDESPWPLVSAIGALYLTMGLLKLFIFHGLSLVYLGLMLILLTMFQWWSDVSSEGFHQGHHSKVVETGLRWGMILFIVSEIMFFFSFFWAFFHMSLSPAIELGSSWPPMGMNLFNPFSVPLLNTIILLSSGVSVTWSHHSLMEGEHSSMMKGLFMTISLGVYFSAVQLMEYKESSFSISDSVFGSVFFLTTGFHGLHVLIGTLFLLVCLVRMGGGQFNSNHHFGFEAAAWYWHFVDVVWLFLYTWVYWWSSL